MSVWIKFEECSAPEEHQDCLVYYHSPSVYFPNLYFMTQSSYYKGRFEIEETVTHWQPLPEPPTA
ncbi:DUF551 domain-containing protein [Pseudomonas petrae]|uniref:DUF551 domain-containing protein n=1 Tax=Pseudomonas petrae TaxID=2912190 RepID=UPI003AFF6342